jgi:hypothetical protein
MTTAKHALYKFSITCKTQDLAVVYCLRAIAEFSQKEMNPRIAWGGTKDGDWKRDGNQVTFHFSSAAIRNSFFRDASRLLQGGSWLETGRRDDDPAKPQH